MEYYYDTFSSSNTTSPSSALRIFRPLHHSLAPPPSGSLHFHTIIADIAASGYRRRLAAANGGVPVLIGWSQPSQPLVVDARVGLRDLVGRLRDVLPVLDPRVTQDHNNHILINGAGNASSLPQQQYPHIPRSYSLSHYLYSRRVPCHAKIIVATLIICHANTPTNTPTAAAGSGEQEQEEGYVRPREGASSAHFRAGPLSDQMWDVRNAVARVDVLGLTEAEWVTVRELLWAGEGRLRCYVIVKGEPCFA